MLEIDTDELAPEHYPVWWDQEFKITWSFLDLSENNQLLWEVGFDERRNTVCSIEIGLKLFPAITYQYQTETIETNLTAGAGMYWLEIDDDVPVERGYERGDLNNMTAAAVFSAQLRFNLTDKLSIMGKAQTWRDQEWLENKYSAEISFDTNNQFKKNQLLFSVDYTEYNLDVYQINSTQLHVLGWDHDIAFRATLQLPI